MIKRQLQEEIERRFFKGKAIIVFGARQVGKSTLMRQIAAKITEPMLMLNCDEPETKALLTDIGTADLRLLVGRNRFIFIDEAQQIADIGLTLKRIVDTFPDVQVLVTGSSAFEIHDKLAEPMTGRKHEYHLYPISSRELFDEKGYLFERQTLEQRLIYGSYPDVINHPEEAGNIVMNIADSYLYKDLLAVESIRKPSLIDKLVKALAFHVGSEVSFNKIAQTVGTDNKTVEKYIDLLEKCYVVFRLDGLSRNMRNELKKSKKIYFWDNGIRNAVIQDFKPVALRQDMGALWENFFISERIRHNHYRGYHGFRYFWRNTQQQEVDYVEEKDGKFAAFEMKWNPKKASVKLPKSFMEAYDVEQGIVVTPENYREWVGIGTDG